MPLKTALPPVFTFFFSSFCIDFLISYRVETSFFPPPSDSIFQPGPISCLCANLPSPVFPSSPLVRLCFHSFLILVSHTQLICAKLATSSLPFFSLLPPKFIFRQLRPLPSPSPSPSSIQRIITLLLCYSSSLFCLSTHCAEMMILLELETQRWRGRASEFFAALASSKAAWRSQDQ